MDIWKIFSKQDMLQIVRDSAFPLAQFVANVFNVASSLHRGKTGCKIWPAVEIVQTFVYVCTIAMTSAWICAVVCWSEHVKAKRSLSFFTWSFGLYSTSSVLLFIAPLQQNNVENYNFFLVRLGLLIGIATTGLEIRKLLQLITYVHLPVHILLDLAWLHGLGCSGNTTMMHSHLSPCHTCHPLAQSAQMYLALRGIPSAFAFLFAIIALNICTENAMPVSRMPESAADHTQQNEENVAEDGLSSPSKQQSFHIMRFIPYNCNTLIDMMMAAREQIKHLKSNSKLLRMMLGWLVVAAVVATQAARLSSGNYVSSPVEVIFALVLGLSVGNWDCKDRASVMWSNQLKETTELVYDLVPSHVADILLRNQRRQQSTAIMGIMGSLGSHLHDSAVDDSSPDDGAGLLHFPTASTADEAQCKEDAISCAQGARMWISRDQGNGGCCERVGDCLTNLPELTTEVPPSDGPCVTTQYGSNPDFVCDGDHNQMLFNECCGKNSILNAAEEEVLMGFQETQLCEHVGPCSSADCTAEAPQALQAAYGTGCASTPDRCGGTTAADNDSGNTRALLCGFLSSLNQSSSGYRSLSDTVTTTSSPLAVQTLAELAGAGNDLISTGEMGEMQATTQDSTISPFLSQKMPRRIYDYSYRRLAHSTGQLPSTSISCMALTTLFPNPPPAGSDNSASERKNKKNSQNQHPDAQEKNQRHAAHHLEEAVDTAADMIHYTSPCQTTSEQKIRRNSSCMEAVAKSERLVSFSEKQYVIHEGRDGTMMTNQHHRHHRSTTMPAYVRASRGQPPPLVGVGIRSCLSSSEATSPLVGVGIRSCLSSSEATSPVLLLGNRPLNMLSRLFSRPAMSWAWTQECTMRTDLTDGDCIDESSSSADASRNAKLSTTAGQPQHLMMSSFTAVQSPLFGRCSEGSPLRGSSCSSPSSGEQQLPTLSPRKHSTAADRRKDDGRDQEQDIIAFDHPSITVLFADIVGFTNLSHKVPPAQMFTFLNKLYARYDAIVDRYNVYKVETIGDCYMCATGLIKPDPDHAINMVKFAIELRRQATLVPLPDGTAVQTRIGIHSGPALSGVIGSIRKRYCVVGSTVNIASRMESTGIPNGIHLSSVTYNLLPLSRPSTAVNNNNKQKCQPRQVVDNVVSTYDENAGVAQSEASGVKEAMLCRGLTDVKGIGPMLTYILEPEAAHGTSR